jgi:hypothetical protein
MADVTARAEAKNEAAREELEPLAEGERPGVVTVAAVISAIITLLAIAGYALWDVLRDEARPNAVGAVSFVLVLGAMAYGLWHARYWAVMGFQATMVLVMVASALGILAGLSIGAVLGNLVLLAGSGTLFYFMVKAMARIQMPERLPRE